MMIRICNVHKPNEACKKTNVFFFVNPTPRGRGACVEMIAASTFSRGSRIITSKQTHVRETFLHGCHKNMGNCANDVATAVKFS